DTFLSAQKISNVGVDCAPNDFRMACARQGLTEVGEFAVNRLTKPEPCACPLLWHQCDVPSCTTMYIISVDRCPKIRDDKKERAAEAARPHSLGTLVRGDPRFPPGPSPGV